MFVNECPPVGFISVCLKALVLWFSLSLIFIWKPRQGWGGVGSSLYFWQPGCPSIHGLKNQFLAIIIRDIHKNTTWNVILWSQNVIFVYLASVLLPGCLPCYQWAVLQSNNYFTVIWPCKRLAFNVHARILHYVRIVISINLYYLQSSSILLFMHCILYPNIPHCQEQDVKHIYI